MSGVLGVERLRPRANGQRSGGGKREKWIDSSGEIAWFGDILNIDGPLVENGFHSVFDNLRAGARRPDGP
jgi:hypothetical protein